LPENMSKLLERNTRNKIKESEMKRAVILGGNGQDGVLITQHLLAKGYKVFSIGRQKDPRLELSSESFSYYQLDLQQSDLLQEFLIQQKPDCVFHVAAIHSSSEANIEQLFDIALKVNVVSVYVVLEYIRRYNAECRLIYASSSKIFGEPYPSNISDQTPKSSSPCLYAVTKNTAYDLIQHYRSQYNLNVSVVFLFNHESEWRKLPFFIPKIVHALGMAINGSSNVTEVFTLDFYCDWGDADEYSIFMIDILEKSIGSDYIIATGTSVYARDFVAALFRKYDLCYQEYIKESQRPGSFINTPYFVKLDKLKKAIGKVPEKDIYSICERILLKNHNLDSFMQCK
jgi:GDPmannose 4,6-dehydratase